MTKTELMIESWSDSARTIIVRGLDSSRSTFSFSHTTNSDRSINKTKHTIDETVALDILSLTVTPTAVPVQRGRLYVRLSILWDDVAIKRLSAGYLTDSKTIAYPPGVFEDFVSGGGYIHTLTGTNPAAAAEISETVPTNCRRRILGLKISLVTDENVVDRFVVVLLDDGTNDYIAVLAPVAHTASKTRYYYLGIGLKKDADFISTRVNMPLPSNLILAQASRMRTVTTNMQAGDDYAAPTYTVEDWLEE